MIVSHSYNHNLPQAGKPAAKCTTEYRLRPATAPLFSGRFAPAPRSGFTLVELLVAMAIMLVGIWALAVGFPKLLGVIALEEKRTEMARQAQRTLDQLTRNRDDLPLAIHADRANTYPETVDANLFPYDPDIADFTMTPPNSRDDIVEIIGERFTLAAPLAPPFGQVPPVPIYVFRQGLAEGWDEDDPTDPPLTFVRQEVVLRPADFTMLADGTVTFVGTVDSVEISYEWVDSGDNTHHVYDELVPNSGDPAYAASLGGNFAGIVSGSCYGIGLIDFTVGHDVAPDTLGPGEVSQHPSGALLRFHQSDVGARLRVSYVLRAGPRPLEPDSAYRRGLIMSEEHRIISRPQVITLVGSHIDDTVYLPVDLDDNVLYDDTHLLAVDLNTGDIYAQGAGLEFAGSDGAGAGRVRIDADPVSLGHDVRFYYATFDQDLITIQIAPQTFMDWDLVMTAGAPSELHRTYKREPLTFDPSNPYALTWLWFHPCSAGQTVTVDYTYFLDPTSPNDGTATIRGEMHTISTEPTEKDFYPDPDPEPWHDISLGEGVSEILAVTGVSLKARAWWRAPNGRVEKLDVTTVR